MNIEDLSFVFRRRREELGLTQRELAERSGVYLRSISTLESGKGNPSMDLLLKLAVVLRLEIIVREE